MRTFRSYVLAVVISSTSAALSGSAAADGNAVFKNFVKTEDPPCRFTPTSGFMKESYSGYADMQMASAAWFARTVQLIDEPRGAAWDNLPEKPIAVRDFLVKGFGLHATLLDFSDRVLLLYRGTEDALDYILNGVFYTTNGEPHGLPGWVHEGFLVNFKMSWPEVRAALKDAAAQGKKIIFSSHSLGGVMSQYAAWLLESEGVPVSRIYAFQSPNSGDLEFKTAYESRFAGRSSNVLYGEDVTPHIPPVFQSADAFSASIPKVLSGLAGRLLKKARYGTSGDRFVVADEGVNVKIPSEQVAAKEVEYWSSYLGKSGGKPFPLGLGSDSPFTADHDVDKVLCSLVKGINRPDLP
jgi:hypothetical protein